MSSSYPTFPLSQFHPDTALVYPKVSPTDKKCILEQINSKQLHTQVSECVEGNPLRKLYKNKKHTVEYMCLRQIQLW
jgi:hypothetical protein